MKQIIKIYENIKIRSLVYTLFESPKIAFHHASGLILALSSLSLKSPTTNCHKFVIFVTNSC